MEPPKNKPSSIYFRFEEIRKISHYENDFTELGLKRSALKHTQFEFKIGLNINSDQDSIAIKIKTDLFVNSNSKKEYLFGIETIHKFKVKDFKIFISNESCDEFNIPDDLMMNFLSNSISGTRSMLATLNTISEYSTLLLPLINIKNILDSIKSKT